MAPVDNKQGLQPIDLNLTEVVFVNEEGSTLSDDVEVKVSVGCLVVVVNLLVLFWLWGKTRTLVDHMMLLDCVSNIGVMTIVLTVGLRTVLTEILPSPGGILQSNYD